MKPAEELVNAIHAYAPGVFTPMEQYVDRMKQCVALVEADRAEAVDEYRKKLIACDSEKDLVDTLLHDDKAALVVKG